MSIYSQPYQALSNGQSGGSGLKRGSPISGESFRLLSISESSDNDELEVKHRIGAKSPPPSVQTVPDLKLNMPTASGAANRVASAAGKIRRKIRLKR